MITAGVFRNAPRVHGKPSCYAGLEPEPVVRLGILSRMDAKIRSMMFNAMDAHAMMFRANHATISCKASLLSIIPNINTSSVR